MIIGISGHKQCGKSTVALLLKRMKGNVIIINFADALKYELARACNTTVEKIDAEKSLYRKLLQAWGTDYRRVQDPDYWTKLWEKKVAYVLSQNPLMHVIAADVRFPNEASIIEENDGVLIRVTRPSDCLLGIHDLHESETALDSYPFDLVIENNGSLLELEEKVKKINI